jgi:hypothetical protein
LSAAGGVVHRVIDAIDGAEPSGRERTPDHVIAHTVTRPEVRAGSVRVQRHA